jgi:hypothetical protein
MRRAETKREERRPERKDDRFNDRFDRREDGSRRQGGSQGFRKRGSPESENEARFGFGRSGVADFKRKKDSRYVNILCFTMIMQCYCIFIVGGTYVPMLAAYDCSKVSEAGLRSASCLHLRQELVQTEEMLGLMKTDFLMSEAVSCEARIRMEKWYCGTASHVHVLDVPHEAQLELSMEECRTTYHTGKYAFDGRYFSVNVGVQNSHSFVVNGSLNAFNEFGSENIACKTLGVYAHENWFPSGFGIGTLNIVVKTKPVMIKDNLVIDADQQVVVGKFVGLHLWAEPVSHFFPYVVRKPSSLSKVMFQDKFNLTKWNGQMYVENLERNILVQVLKTETFSLQHLDFTILVTELDGVKFLVKPQAAVRSYFGDILRQESSFDINSMFLASRERNERVMEWYSISKCTPNDLNTNMQVKQGYKVVFLGEIARYEKCTRVDIPIKTGENLGCAVGHLLLNYNGMNIGVQEYSRLIASTTQVKMANCTENPIFLKLTDNLFVGNTGDGLQILHIENVKSEHIGQKIYTSDEKTFLADFNGTIRYNGLEDLEDFGGQASKLDIVEEKMSFLEEIMSPVYSIDHLFTYMLPLLLKLLVLGSIFIAAIIIVYCVGSWCYKKRYTEEEFNART